MSATTDIVVLSHGNLAKSLVETAVMIAGRSDNVHYVCLEEGEGPDSFRNKVISVLDRLTSKDVVFLIDLFGGTPSNTASMLFFEHMAQPAEASTPKKAFGIMAGVNLGLLLEAMSNQHEMGAEQLVSHLVDVSSTTIVDVVEVLKEQLKRQDAH